MKQMILDALVATAIGIGLAAALLSWWVA